MAVALPGVARDPSGPRRRLVYILVEGRVTAIAIDPGNTPRCRQSQSARGSVRESPPHDRMRDSGLHREQPIHEPELAGHEGGSEGRQPLGQAQQCVRAGLLGCDGEPTAPESCRDRKRTIVGALNVATLGDASTSLMSGPRFKPPAPAAPLRPSLEHHLRAR